VAADKDLQFLETIDHRRKFILEKALLINENITSCYDQQDLAAGVSMDAVARIKQRYFQTKERKSVEQQPH
jgi:hypothetical protein